MKQLVIVVLWLALGGAVGFVLGVRSNQVRGYRSCVLSHVKPGLSDRAVKLIQETCLGMFPPRVTTEKGFFDDLYPEKQ